MKTYEIKKEDLKGLKLLATGYKVVKYDNGTLQDFKYAPKYESLVGRVFKVDGDIAECKWGLHFCKNPAMVFDYYSPLGYNRYFKINAYGKVVDSDDCKKSVAQIIKFEKEYDIKEFVDIVKQLNGLGEESEHIAVNCSDAVNRSNAVNRSIAVDRSNAVNWSNAVDRSNAVNCSDAVDRSNAVNWSNAVNRSIAVDRSNAVNWSNAVDRSNAVNCSDAVDRSTAVNWSNAVNRSIAVNWSNAVNRSIAVDRSNAVNCSDAVDRSNAVNWSNAVNRSNAVDRSTAVSDCYGVSNCSAVKCCLFCHKIEAKKYYLFNKKVKKERVEEVYSKIKSFSFFPKYNNFYDLKSNKEWYSIAFSDLMMVSNATAWENMPEEMKDYLKSLPEYDEKIFDKITK